MKDSQLRQHSPVACYRSRLLWTAIIALVCAPGLSANFIGTYSVDQFSKLGTTYVFDWDTFLMNPVTYVPDAVCAPMGCGSAISPDNGASVVITGIDNGGGTPGTIDFFTAAAGSGLVTFDYTYSAGYPDWPDTPGYDDAGFLLDGTFMMLADTDGESATSMSFQVNTGDTFGFRVWTADGLGGPGTFTISNFSAPGTLVGAQGGAPEPATTWLVPVGILLIAIARMSVLRARRATRRTS